MLQALASKSPTPGGGAVAALTLALGAALAQMVLNYSIGKKSLEAHAHIHEEALSQLQEMRDRALELADEDAAAYQALNAMLRRKDDPPSVEERKETVAHAISIPMEILQHAAKLAELLGHLAGTTNTLLDSDLAMAAILADAAAQSACWNVRINLPALADEADRAKARAEMDELAQRAAGAARRVQDSLRANVK
ncbi:MAG: cyclodeaminase/cyclohydrolase family protein [Candidatus Acidiferrales bacterium]